MPNLEDLTGRPHLSYSSLTSWLDCGERFRLERVMSAPQTNAWWFLGGDTVHRATEQADKENITDPQAGAELFDAIWQVAISKLDPNETLKAGGRVSKQYPNKEDGQWWADNGPRMVADWITWRVNKFNEGWQFLPIENADGNIYHGVEVPVEFTYKAEIGSPVEIKGYIDRVMVDPQGQVWVVDLKSGSREPASSLQLGIYSLGLAEMYGITAPLGAYYMTRTGDLGKTNSLAHYSRHVVGGWFSMAKTGIEAEVFIPKVGPFCGSCSVRQYCTAVGGDPNLLTPNA